MVGDDGSFRRALRLALSEQGHEVTEAAGGVETLESLEKRRTDLVLLDWHMPDISGLETCRLVHGRFTTPVIVISSDRTLDQSGMAWPEPALFWPSLFP